MAVNNLQRLQRLLFKIAESDDATMDQRLDAARQLVELTQPKKPRTKRGSKPVSTLLGSK